jgi:hypothetical protein
MWHGKLECHFLPFTYTHSMLDSLELNERELRSATCLCSAYPGYLGRRSRPGVCNILAAGRLSTVATVSHGQEVNNHVHWNRPRLCFLCFSRNRRAIHLLRLVIFSGEMVMGEEINVNAGRPRSGLPVSIPLSFPPLSQPNLQSSKAKQRAT